MPSLDWLKKAALATALFVAGVAAGDLAVRGGHSSALPEVASAPVQVVHKRKVRTVHPRPAAASTRAPATPAGATVVSAPSATPVSSRTSPGATGGGDDGAEAERGD